MPCAHSAKLQQLDLQRKNLLRESARQNQTIIEQARPCPSTHSCSASLPDLRMRLPQNLQLKQKALAAESAATRSWSDEQATRVMEDDLADAKERAQILQRELAEMREREVSRGRIVPLTPPWPIPRLSAAIPNLKLGQTSTRPEEDRTRIKCCGSQAQSGQHLFPGVKAPADSLPRRNRLRSESAFSWSSLKSNTRMALLCSSR